MDFWRTVDELWLLYEHSTIWHISNHCIIRNNDKKFKKSNVKCYFKVIQLLSIRRFLDRENKTKIEKEGRKKNLLL